MNDVSSDLIKVFRSRFLNCSYAGSYSWSALVDCERNTRIRELVLLMYKTPSAIKGRYALEGFSGCESLEVTLCDLLNDE